MYCWKRSPYSGLHYKHKAVRCHARNAKFAVISCFITPNWKHVAGEWRQRWLTWSITIGTRLRPGLQGAGKTLVYSQQYTSHQRRQLLLLFHPLTSIPAHKVIFTSCIAQHISLGLSVLFWRHATWLLHFIFCLHFYCTVLIFHASRASADIDSSSFFLIILI